MMKAAYITPIFASLSNAILLDWYTGASCNDQFLGQTKVGEGNCRNDIPVNARSVLIRLGNSPHDRAVVFYKGDQCDADEVGLQGTVGCLHISSSIGAYAVANVWPEDTIDPTFADTQDNVNWYVGAQRRATIDADDEVSQFDEERFEFVPNFANVKEQLAWEKEKFARDNAVHGASYTFAELQYRLQQVAHGAWVAIAEAEWKEQLRPRNDVILPTIKRFQPSFLGKGGVSNPNGTGNFTLSPPGIDTLPGVCTGAMDCALELASGTFDIASKVGEWTTLASRNCAAEHNHHCTDLEATNFLQRHPVVFWLAPKPGEVIGGYFSSLWVGSDDNKDKEAKAFRDCSDESVFKTFEEYTKQCVMNFSSNGHKFGSMKCAVEFKNCMFGCEPFEGHIFAQATPHLREHATNQAMCESSESTKRELSERAHKFKWGQTSAI